MTGSRPPIPPLARPSRLRLRLALRRGGSRPAGRAAPPPPGAGNSLGLARAGAARGGVGGDRTPAAIAQALYPDATILAESFADPRIPEGSFDVAVGNVPFADVTLTDPSHNPSRLSIHNHFI